LQSLKKTNSKDIS